MDSPEPGLSRRERTRVPSRHRRTRRANKIKGVYRGPARHGQRYLSKRPSLSTTFAGRGEWRDCDLTPSCSCRRRIIAAVTFVRRPRNLRCHI